MKKVFYSELAYVLGMLTLALGCAFMEKADFGLSMVVAPAYILYLKLSEVWSFITFGMMEYLLQAALLILMIIAMRRFKVSYLFSFVTAVIYGYTLNGTMALVGLLGEVGMVVRIVMFCLGMVFCSIGVACMIHTYLSPEVYELIVKEIPNRFGFDLTKFKTVYDCVSCLLSVIMSFCFFGLWQFEGIKLGTVICALVNGFLIGRISAFMTKKFEFKDILPLRNFF
jgi:uncharacterized membrane protein YczE